MILIDTGALVALCNPRDRWHQRSLTDLDSLQGPYGVIEAVLVEAHFLLKPAHIRARIPTVLTQLQAQHISASDQQWRSTFDWMEKYSQHEPDLCDALLIALGGKVWTYDREFVTTWRALDGTPVPLANQP